ncbi:MAG: DUF2752 domain-containing protein [Planctomycetes bacterium]|nr:DUF2752 domain-containing protein [Planctomycetota bacterium]
MAASSFPARRADRPLLLACLLGATAAVALALWLRPDPRGFGTHEQLGLLPCGFKRVTGLPCPTCGMTTSFALLARGRLAAAADVQPFGAFLFLATIGAGLLSAAELFARYPFLDRLAAVRWRWFGPLLAACFFLAWGWACARAAGIVG